MYRDFERIPLNHSRGFPSANGYRWFPGRRFGQRWTLHDDLIKYHKERFALRVENDEFVQIRHMTDSLLRWENKNVSESRRFDSPA